MSGDFGQTWSNQFNLASVQASLTGVNTIVGPSNSFNGYILGGTGPANQCLMTSTTQFLASTNWTLVVQTAIDTVSNLSIGTLTFAGIFASGQKSGSGIVAKSTNGSTWTALATDSAFAGGSCVASATDGTTLVVGGTDLSTAVLRYTTDGLSWSSCDISQLTGATIISSLS